jgi:hypothetical protein
MKHFSKNLLVFFKNGFMTEQAWEHEVEALTSILRITESTVQFCTATELVDRNRITSNPKKILKESAHYRLRAFRFLINKN